SHGVALQEASPAMGIHGPEDPDGEVTDQKERYGGGQSRAHHAYWGGPAHNELPHKESSRVPGADYEEVPRLGDSVVDPCEIDIGGGEHQHWDGEFLAGATSTEVKQRSAYGREVEGMRWNNDYRQAHRNGNQDEEIGQHDH